MNFIFSFYLLSLMFLLCFNSFFSFWLMMELNTVTFIVLILFNNKILENSKKDLINQCFYYFILQSLTSILIFLSFNIGNFFFIEILDLTIICLVFKMGLFPFYFWIFKLIKYLDYFSIFLMLGPQKIFLMTLIFLNLNFSLILIFWSCLFFGAILMNFSFDMKELLLGSSISGIMVMNLMYNSSITFFFLYFFFYIFSLYILLMNFSFESYISSAIFLISSLIFMSSPFFSFFVLKFQMFKFVSYSMSEFEFFFFWIGMFLCFLGYLIYFFFNLSFSYMLYNFNQQLNLFLYSFFLIFFFFFF